MAADVYFGNKVSLLGKVETMVEDNDSFMSFRLETREAWSDTETLTEHHEVRYYKTSLKPQLAFEAIAGRLVEISGRIRLKDGTQSVYSPFIHCLKLNVLAA